MPSAISLRIAEIERERARRAAGRSLRANYRFVFRLDPPPHAEVILDAAEAVLAGEIQRLVILAPPGHGKSTICSVILPTYECGRNPDARLLGISTTDGLGSLFHASCQSIMESSADWRETFPDVSPDLSRGWSHDGLYLRHEGHRRAWQDKDPNLVFTGAGGPVIGRRSTGIIVDDPIDEKQARSEVMLEARKQWFSSTGFSRLVKGGWIIAVGTRWTDDDVVGTWAADPAWTVIHLRAQAATERQRATVIVGEGCNWRPPRGVPVREAA